MSRASSSKKQSGSGSTAMVARSVLGPWDVRMPPVKRHMVQGHLVPTFKPNFFIQKKRRITIELLTPQQKKPASSWDPVTGTLGDQDSVVFRIFRLSRHKGSNSEDEDDASISTMGSVDEKDEGDGGSSSGKAWREHLKCKSADFEISKVFGRTVEIKTGAGNDLIVRDLKFKSIEEAKKFQNTCERIRQQEKERTKRQIVTYKKTHKSGGSGVKGTAGDELLNSPMGASEMIQEDDEEINLLVEIVSANDLPIGDITSSDPYVIVFMNGKELHRTAVIHNNLNPIWTLSTGSLFLVEMTPEEFFSSSAGMTFVIKDEDTIGSNETLATVTVPLEVLLEGKGERVGYVIEPHDKPDKKPEREGKLFLRFKKATAEDIDFMHAFNESSTQQFGKYADETFFPIRMQSTKFLKRQEKKGPNREVLHRVRPGPDPDRLDDETKWLTNEQIQEEAMKPSTHWVEAGSGDIGKLYFEVIGCDNLPNMDSSTLNVRDKTDAFACLVYEDCIVNTEVIGDCLSPRWMPWTYRAFAFNIGHPSSDVLLGLFDYDPELSPMQLLSRAVANDLHDPIGRLVIELSKFQPNTTYVLKYPLYYGELKEHRVKDRGTVTIRLRIEFPDVRAAMVRGLVSPPPTVVSVARQIDYRVARYATDGVVDEDKFSLDILSRYVEELQSYDVLLEYISSAFMVVWLWRGHFTVNLAGKSFKLPLHSITAFIWGLLVTWNYNLVPSFFLFSIGWIMLACNEQMRIHPSRWHHSPSYYDFLYRLVVNKAKSETVPADMNLGAIQAYEKKSEELRIRRADEAKREEEHELKMQEALGADMAETEQAEQIGSKGGGGFFDSVNPLKPILYPVQKQLQSVIETTRIAKSIILWNEAYYAFWIVTFCFVGSVAICWVPWVFLSVWFLRIAVFVGLGPWMAIVDRLYFKANPNMSDEEREEVFKRRLNARYEEVLLSATNYQIRKEHAVKMHNMKKYMFGQHLLRVPLFHEDLFFDLPLPSSSATPVVPESAHPIHIEERKFGQHLEGDMIPQREIQNTHKPDESRSKKTTKRFWRKVGIPERIPLLGQAAGNKSPVGYDSVEVEEK